MEPGRLELYPYHTFIESSEESAVPALVLSRNKMLVLYVTPTQGSKVSGNSSVSHRRRHFMKIGRCFIFHEDVSNLLSGWLPYPPTPPSLLSLPPSFPLSPRLISPSIPRGGEGSGEDFRAAGGDRLSVPSTYTNGRISAPHKNN